MVIFLKKFILIFFLLIVLVYATNITSIPNQIILFEGESLNIQTILGVALETKPIVETTKEIAGNNFKSEIAQVKLFDTIKIKEIEVSTIPRTTVIPLGDVIGLKLYSAGVLVIGLTEIEGKRPYENTKIEEGDIIVEINNKEIESADELLECVKQSNGESLEIKLIKNGEMYQTEIKPILNSKNEYKLGLWVKDGAVGLGTITFYEPSTKQFAALGHGISDKDTEQLITISEGEVLEAEISSIKQGENGIPGEIKGMLAENTFLGTVEKNSEFGVYGTIQNTTFLNINSKKQYEVALREEIKTGKAEILLNLSGEKRESYEIKIKKIYLNNNEDNKSMLIEVTDKELLEKTGGIIQGMSGTPIIQNGKFVGAITHVLVQNPKQGYAVFGDLMIKQMQ